MRFTGSLYLLHDRPQLTVVDNKLDALSPNPTKQRFEKTMSGMYLGELVRLSLEELTSAAVLTWGGTLKPSSSSALSQPWKFQTKFMAEIGAPFCVWLRSYVRGVCPGSLSLVCDARTSSRPPQRRMRATTCRVFATACCASAVLRPRARYGKAHVALKAPVRMHPRGHSVLGACRCCFPTPFRTATWSRWCAKPLLAVQPSLSLVRPLPRMHHWHRELAGLLLRLCLR